MLSNKIKELRLSFGLNQVEFAKKLSITKQTVSNWENNNILPSIEMLTKIADYFNVTTDYLLDRDKRRLINVSGLSEEEIAHLSMIINDLSK